MPRVVRRARTELGGNLPARGRVGQGRLAGHVPKHRSLQGVGRGFPVWGKVSVSCIHGRLAGLFRRRCVISRTQGRIAVRPAESARRGRNILPGQFDHGGTIESGMVPRGSARRHGVLRGHDGLPLHRGPGAAPALASAATMAFGACDPPRRPEQLFGNSLSGRRRPHSIGPSRVLPCRHERITPHNRVSSPVRRRRLLLRRARHRRRWGWPDPADMPHRLLDGRISREDLTG